MGTWLSNIKRFILGTIEEVEKCTWPKRDELFKTTVVVIVSVIIVAAFVALVDFGSQKIIMLLSNL